jgi:hypothetical protein
MDLNRYNSNWTSEQYMKPVGPIDDLPNQGEYEVTRRISDYPNQGEYEVTRRISDYPRISVNYTGDVLP